jgi:hypothetical protein
MNSLISNLSTIDLAIFHAINGWCGQNPVFAIVVSLFVARLFANLLPFRVRPMFTSGIGYRPPLFEMGAYFENWSSFPSDTAVSPVCHDYRILVPVRLHPHDVYCKDVIFKGGNHEGPSNFADLRGTFGRSCRFTGSCMRARAGWAVPA